MTLIQAQSAIAELSNVTKNAVANIGADIAYTYARISARIAYAAGIERLQVFADGGRHQSQDVTQAQDGSWWVVTWEWNNGWSFVTSRKATTTEIQTGKIDRY